MTNPIDDYMRGTKAIPLPPNSQQEAELYNSETEKAIEGQTESQTQLAIEINKDLENAERKRRYDAEKELYESNQKEAERKMEEYNSQRELDDLDESEQYDDDDTYLENSEFSGNYFEKPENEEPSFGDRVRAKYDSFSEKAGSAAGSFVSGFNKKMDSFERGDPLYNTKPAKGRSIRYVSRPSRQNRAISRPYVGGRFGGDELILGTTNTNNLYYPVADAGRSPQSTMDAYLPSGAVYEGEFSNFNARNEFANSKYANNKEDTYDPFGFGGLSGNGFKNTEKFGDTLMGFNSDLLGGGAGNDTVFGSIGKKESSGFGLDMIIGNNGGMFNIIDPSPRKTTTKRKPANKTTKKASKAKPTRRKQATRRKQTYTGFTLP